MRIESLTVIREMGVQIETKLYNGRQTHEFIEKSKIKSIIINEGFQDYSVQYYMAFIVEDRDNMVLAFKVVCGCVVVLSTI